MTTIKKNCLCNIHVNKSLIPTQNLWVSMSSHTVLKSKKRRRENCLRIWKTHKEFDEPIELMSLETINNEQPTHALPVGSLYAI